MVRTVALLVFATLVSTRLAYAGDSLDIEIARPTFSPDAMPGFESTSFNRTGTWRLGLQLQYDRDPLLLYKFTDEVGAVVANRDTLYLGLAWQASKRLGFRVILPAAAQWGTDVPALAGDGVGLGDASGGFRVRVIDTRNLNLAADADLLLPTSTQGMYMGERAVRLNAGVAGDLVGGRMRLVLGLHTLLRPPVDSQYDFVLGSELSASLGLRYEVWPDKATLQTALLGRAGYDHFLATPAENPLAWMTGLAVLPRKDVQIDALVGRGLTAGYGTPQFRATLGVTYIHRPKPAAAVAVVTQAPTVFVPEDIEFDPVEEPKAPEPPKWAEGELARVEAQQIVIRDPIQFELGTDRILLESEPTLRAIAKVLADKPQILDMVIEGHASEEGSFIYNYDLSLTRAQAINRRLVEVGVHPARLSCRGMGETLPVAPPPSAGAPTPQATEAALALNRRVVFHIVHQLAPGEAWPEYGTTTKVPWTGDERAVAPLPPPIPATRVPEPKEDDE
ncbi:MAG: OmpA family protein [Myxococcales bacterium]|nr:OmpA family protein [Myxococcales bacterium]